jgi:hypothetical protein
MKKSIFIVFLILMGWFVNAQSFEVGSIAENYKGYVGDQIIVPVFLKNTSNKTITLVIKRSESQIGSTQKNIICPDGNCADFLQEEYTVKLEPGQAVQNLSLGLDAGLVQGSSRVKYLVYNKYNPNDITELDLFFSVEEKPAKTNIFTSRQITIQEVYPNPVADFAYIDYRLSNSQVKAKIVIHNILGSALAEYELSAMENKVKIRADDLAAGVYFYTLYLDNEGVMTRKLIVKR